MIRWFVLLLASTQLQASENNQLQGGWDVKSIRWISDEQTHELPEAQPGMFIFSDNHYALMWSPKQSPRVPFKELAKPTDEEILAGFKSIVFNSGSYVVTDKELTTTARVAKVPGFEGGELNFKYQFKDDLLILTLYDETYPDGKKPDWSGKWQTEFTLTKAK